MQTCKIAEHRARIRERGKELLKKIGHVNKGGDNR